MITMTEKFLISCVIGFVVAISVSLILPTHSNEIKLSLNPAHSHFSVPVGRSFNIVCSGEAEDGRSFTVLNWLHPNGNIIPDGVPGVSRPHRNALSLSFVDPSEDDSGFYTCSGSFDGESLEIKTYINFYVSEPRFEWGYENQTVREGSRLELVCEATGDPIPDYRWYDQYENEITSNDASFYVRDSGNSSSLIILHVTEAHDGFYTCVANNTHGTGSKLYKVDVVPFTGNETGNDTARIKSVSVIKVTDSSVQFDIQIIGRAENIFVEYREKLDRMTTSKQLKVGGKYEFKDLISAGDYTFKFSIQEGTATSVRVTLLPAVPEIIFRRLEGGTLEIEWFRKFDDIRRETIDKYELSYYTVQMVSGNSWKTSNCPITIDLPTPCASARYTISGLFKDAYYEIRLRAHTSSGFGKSNRQKLWI